MRRRGKYPEEIQREAVRLVRAHRDEYGSEWAIMPVASKFGAVPQTVCGWVCRADVDDGVVCGVSSDDSWSYSYWWSRSVYCYRIGSTAVLPRVQKSSSAVSRIVSCCVTYNTQLE